MGICLGSRGSSLVLCEFSSLFEVRRVELAFSLPFHPVLSLFLSFENGELRVSFLNDSFGGHGADWASPSDQEVWFSGFSVRTNA